MLRDPSEQPQASRSGSAGDGDGARSATVSTCAAKACSATHSPLGNQYFLIRTGVAWVNLSQNGPTPRWKRPAHRPVCAVDGPDAQRLIPASCDMAGRLGAESQCAPSAPAHPTHRHTEAPWLANSGRGASINGDGGPGISGTKTHTRPNQNTRKSKQSKSDSRRRHPKIINIGVAPLAAKLEPPPAPQKSCDGPPSSAITQPIGIEVQPVSHLGRIAQKHRHTACVDSLCVPPTQLTSAARPAVPNSHLHGIAN
eukprot:SAG25_NODE_1412_length_3089_cov_1.668562_3_plen_255_part_00